ncbi:MAG TPA: glucose-1-phosphate cytidylyltransferase [Terracidiphilus sp.]|nr:glucose-1-phosphate cytidylyltransferase [Terracidiphilus sp.]
MDFKAPDSKRGFEMKVVLFCGGLGLRIRDMENVPKPLVQIGYRPVLWHVMKYYAHYGHKDFILCLGYGADSIKKYFLEYSECASNDFVLSYGGKKVELFNSDIHDWRITFADTGVNSNIGQRLKAVEKYLQGEEEFLANYSDGLTDLPLPQQLDDFHRQKKIASFLCVLPNLSYHVVSTAPGSSLVTGIQAISDGTVRINGGYFAFRKEIFDYLREGEELVLEPFQRLIEEKQLVGYSYDGFWAGMDTFKDRQQLETLWGNGTAPWHVWRANGNGSEEAKPTPPVAVAEFIERRNLPGNGITGSRKSISI